MAQQDYSGLITVGVIGAAAWYAYQQGWLSGLFGSPAVATVPTGTSTAITPVTTTSAATSTPPSSTSTQPVPVTADPVATSNLVQLLLNASGGVSRLTIDGWAYYYNALPGKPTITPVQMEAMIGASNGVVTDANRSTQNITPDAFVSLLNGQGLSGLGNYHGVPYGMIHGGGW